MDSQPVKTLKQELLAAVRDDPIVAIFLPRISEASTAQVLDFCKDFGRIAPRLQLLIGAPAVGRLRPVVERFLAQNHSLCSDQT